VRRVTVHEESVWLAAHAWFDRVGIARDVALGHPLRPDCGCHARKAFAAIGSTRAHRHETHRATRFNGESRVIRAVRSTCAGKSGSAVGKTPFQTVEPGGEPFPRPGDNLSA
jgi:hypothetical protein